MVEYLKTNRNRRIGWKWNRKKKVHHRQLRIVFITTLSTQFQGKKFLISQAYTLTILC